MRRSKTRSELFGICDDYMKKRAERRRTFRSSHSLIWPARKSKRARRDCLEPSFMEVEFSRFCQGMVGGVDGSAFCTYGLLLTAQPPRESAESAYFFLLPCLIWFSFKPNWKKVCIAFLSAGVLYHLTLVGWIRHITLPGMLGNAFFFCRSTTFRGSFWLEN